MHIRRWVLTPLVVGAVAAAAALYTPVAAQQPQAQKKDKKLEKAQQVELQTVARMADAAMAGQPAPSDVKMTFHNDSLKAQEGRTFVPFTVTIDPATLPGKAVTVYLRVVAKSAQPTPPPAEAKDKKPGSDYAFEDVYFLDLKAPEAGQPYRVRRAFAVPAGDYDIYVVTKERLAPGAKEKEQAAAKAGVLKEAVTVPDYWNGELTTSSVILADKVDPITTPLTPQEQIDQPYTFGMTQITPALDSTFTKKEELSIVFLVYNTQVDANRKPDMVIDYSFYRKTEGAENGEKFFNKTQPQAFNATTLPPQFDTAQGHQLVAGQSVPLASFPEGVYRLDIKVTDKLSGKSINREVTFTVTP